MSKTAFLASRTGSPPPSSPYDNQLLQLFSGSIDLRPAKFGMLVYHNIAQVQLFYFFEIRNIFRNISIFLKSRLDLDVFWPLETRRNFRLTFNQLLIIAAPSYLACSFYATILKGPYWKIFRFQIFSI